MNKLLLLLAAFSVYILVAACGDDNKPADETSICERKLPFGKRLANQTKNVLLPLEVGREWHYKVTNKGVVSYDTIKVLSKEKCADGEWYRVDFPLFSAEPMQMINTTTGLWYKCAGCNDEAAPISMADYPLYKQKFTIGDKSPVLYYELDDKGEVIGQRIVEAYACSESKPFSGLKANNKTFSGNQYIQTHMICPEGPVRWRDTLRYYFTPGFGMVKLYFRDRETITCELID